MRRILSFITLALLLVSVASAVGGHRTILNWNPVTTYTNGSALPAQVCYNIYKSSDGQSWALAKSDVALTTTSWADENVLPGQTTWYKVTVYDKTNSQESAASNIVQAVTP